MILGLNNNLKNNQCACYQESLYNSKIIIRELFNQLFENKSWRK